MSPSLLTLDHITFKVPTLEKPILKNISFSVHPEDFIVLLGSNGSGKSSLLKIIQGAYTPSSGKLLFQGAPLGHLSLLEKAQKIVTFSQNLEDSLFMNGTVLENCYLWESRYHLSLRDLERKNPRALYKEYLRDYNPKLPSLLDQPVKDLSGGEKQSLLLGLCLKHPPQLLLMDEHTSALDPKTSSKVMAMTHSFIEKFKVPTLMALHSLEKALQFGNRLLALKEGEIVLDVKGEDKKKLHSEDLLSLYQ